MHANGFFESYVSEILLKFSSHFNLVQDIVYFTMAVLLVGFVDAQECLYIKNDVF